LPQEESKIIELKYAGKRFGIMELEEIMFSSKTLLFKISAITGWTLPISEMLTILIDQFSKTLTEKYRFTNIDEFEYAFRSKGLEIKDWGKAINLSLIDEIMIPYLEGRAELSRLEEQKSVPIIEEPKQLNDEQWEEWLIDIKGYPLELIPIAAYDYLLRIGRINPTTKDKKEYMNKAIPLHSINIQDDLRKWNEFLKMKMDNKITGNHFDSCVVISKRLIVQDYFKLTNNV